KLGKWMSSQLTVLVAMVAAAWGLSSEPERPGALAPGSSVRTTAIPTTALPGGSSQNEPLSSPSAYTQRMTGDGSRSLRESQANPGYEPSLGEENISCSPLTEVSGPPLTERPFMGAAGLPIHHGLQVQ